MPHDVEALTKSVIVVTMVSYVLGAARVRQIAKICLIAMFFVVFDLEGVFRFSWAVAGSELGWTRLLGGFDLHALATVVIANWVLSKTLLHLIQGPDCRNGVV